MASGSQMVKAVEVLPLLWLGVCYCRDKISLPSLVKPCGDPITCYYYYYYHHVNISIYMAMSQKKVISSAGLGFGTCGGATNAPLLGKIPPFFRFLPAKSTHGYCKVLCQQAGMVWSKQSKPSRKYI